MKTIYVLTAQVIWKKYLEEEPGGFKLPTDQSLININQLKK